VQLVNATEALKLRRTYRLLTGWLMAHAYLTGMKDVLGSHAAALPFLREFINHKRSTALSAELGEWQRLSVPRDAADVAIRVTFRGHTLCDTAALEPAREWSWDEVVERVTSACLVRVKEVIALDDLVRVAAPRGVAG
jgi:hypothetical protein